MTTSGTPKRPRLAAYLRVSWEQQETNGAGLDTQEAACRAWAEANGYDVTRVYMDAATGASDVEDRYGLVTVMADIEAGKVAGVIVARLDRLARDVIVQEGMVGRVRMAGGRVFSADPTEAHLLDDPDDELRQAMRRLVGVMAEYDRALLRKRLAAGKARKQEAGGYVGGRPPLGFKASAGRLVVDAQEQSAVARAVELRSVGHTYRQIAATLADEGYRTKDGAATWHSETIRRLCVRHGVERLDRSA